MARATYLVALGGNRWSRHGGPAATVRAAAATLGKVATLVALSPIIDTPPLGPSSRRFANAVALVESEDTPPALLARLKEIERTFGRRRGRRWGARSIDLDIVLWSGGRWMSPGLEVPHRAFRERTFVLEPAVAIAPEWHDPVSGLTLRQLLGRLTRTRPMPRARRVDGSGP
ncbi:2-amino-4-hydroxy-6-hydroxymethyldihydropteridinediphosphokinase [Sphingomonas gellani]|uniref:2-amino-4-hydroxy-6-hydroxymethyldihydropteridine pyrophosphokinase n=1 Tax=Sphingomonas gellani TaxID=1166340 RepID=A0A1H8AIV1_9SPHN|nr:2-amino-4-hydroxy-6-hydroxymethyldihydropteridine diphosphokinase [Sphingomonas gellani]SEM70722.1 2-amino-4-hydroxy-6-hydroxymethyldihydropteridinediphosphokinase [Sphingomonas gellani]